MTRYGALALALVFVAACSGDDESGTPAGSGGMGGGSGGMGGATGGMGGATGGMGGATGGVGGGSGGLGGMTGGMGGMTGGMGGSGGMIDDAGMNPDDDGGVEEPDAEVDAGSDAGADAGDDASADAGALYEEGAQNGACRAAGTVCDTGLGCYEPDGNNFPRFCTLECTEDADCGDLSGAEWTCWVQMGLCRVECEPANDNDDCPAGFECINVLDNNRCMPIE